MKKFTTVDEYIGSFSSPTQAKLNQLRKAIAEVTPQAEEKISYSMVGYKLCGKRFMYLGGFKNHVSLFPASSKTIEAFKVELEGFETSKGTIRFPLDKPLPITLIKKVIKFRALDNLPKK